MKQLKISAVLCFVFLSLWSSFGQADTQFRIIIDASGSMQSNDPDHITSEALRLIADLSPENTASLGVWLFGEQARVLFPETVLNGASKAQLASHVNQYVRQDLKTDLESILKLLLAAPDTPDLAPGYRRDWILVTDGMVDISRDQQVNDASRQRIWGQITQQLEAKGIHLHTISLTGYTDKALLDHLSYRTNATHTDLAVPDDLLDTFEQIYSQAAPAAELPLTEAGFKVDPSINEMTIEVLHEVGQLPKLVQPNGEVLPLLSRPGLYVADAPHYTLFTVTNPAIGQWRLENADIQRSHVRIVSSWLANATKIPEWVFTKQGIDSSVALFQHEKALTDASILANTKVTQRLFRVAGGQQEPLLTWDMTRTGDVFKSHINGLEKPGIYQLISTVHSDFADRSVRQYIRVQPAVSFYVNNEGANLVTFFASATNAVLDTAKSSMTLKLLYGDGTQQIETMPFIDEGYWEKIVPLGADSFAKASATLNGVTLSGNKVQYTTPVWSIERQGSRDVSIQLGDLTPSQVREEFDASVASNQQVAALQVSPSVEVVNDGNQQTEPEPTSQVPPAAQTNVVAQVTKEVQAVTQASWFIYALIALVALVLIILVFIFSRPAKEKGRH
ncbi:VWA domain-containing protein [Marinomonas pollencensis]|uniref:von Willebrand factor type A domain-containing protein n=1 Tax=Marinomonas pollencensis TaxID=491954 RepID=A0A3E0DS66_9GAMM|nr:vWA domain-containing protein [Marinomonas pollencensis]REG85864.1 von Willebrand factor type A domain-containing protein [Marinomonas pollencensis]